MGITRSPRTSVSVGRGLETTLPGTGSRGYHPALPAGGEHRWRTESRSSGTSSRSTSSRPGEVPGGGGRPAAPPAHERAPPGHGPRGEARRDPRAARPGDGPEPEARRRPAGERDKIEALAEEVEKLSQPPATFGVYLATNDDGSIDVFTAGRKMRVMPAPDIDERVVPPGRPGRAERVAQRGRGARARPRGRGREGQGPPGRRPRDRGRPRRRGERRVPRRASCSSSTSAPATTCCSTHAPGVATELLPEGGGRGARPRGDPRRQLRGHRRSRGPDRLDPRRRRAAVPVRGAVPRARARAAEGRAAVRAARVRQDADREGGGEVARREGRRAHRPRATPAATS